MLDFGVPMGPFALMDENRAGHRSACRGGARGGRSASASARPSRSSRRSSPRGRLGREERARASTSNKTASEPRTDAAVPKLAGAAAPLHLPVETAQERMVLAMVQRGRDRPTTTAWCASRATSDCAMVYGTGFPTVPGGPASVRRRRCRIDPPCSWIASRGWRTPQRRTVPARRTSVGKWVREERRCYPPRETRGRGASLERRGAERWDRNPTPSSCLWHPVTGGPR